MQAIPKSRFAIPAERFAIALLTSDIALLTKVIAPQSAKKKSSEEAQQINNAILQKLQTVNLN